MNNYQWHTGLSVCSMSVLVTGCTLLAPVRQPDTFVLSAPAARDVEPLAARVAVQTVDGRSPYQRRAITVIPEPYKLASYPYSQWASSVCDMAGECLLSYLGSRCEYVTSASSALTSETDWLLKTYIDTFDQVKREDRWYADLRITYEVILLKNNTVAARRTFEQSVALENKSITEYVTAQNESFQAFLEQLTIDLAKAQRTSRTDR